jgi:imidazoleglycerol-phosphate dehydratase
MSRSKRINRKTKETDVTVKLDLDGTGKYSIDLPDKWLKHMLESVARFGQFDLEIKAEGDFNHHIVEDVALTFGKTLRESLEGRPVQRIGTATIPMDEALVTVSVDLVDRPYCQVDLPDEMLEHFFRSLALEARITLHNLVHRGKNFHHINEATFKAFGLALRQATRVAGELQSTKGKVHWKK